ncbi:alanine dehydrogenase [Candidatus Woesearchaeota archaeon]|nr:alanine dehydrogenase [Candidatus Woesearchaeota archaeon]
MIIGCIKEVKTAENRVGLIPSGVKMLVHAGHKVVIEKRAGIGAGFGDEEYRKAGAKLAAYASDVVVQCDTLIKVKEPVPAEYRLLDKFMGKTLFTYLHLAAADKELTRRLLKNRITAIAYETVEDKKGSLPLLKPMSQVAGVLAVQYAAQYLQKKYRGRGVSLGKIEHTAPAQVVVVGGGVVGSTAARTAAGLGCKVTVLQRRGPAIAFLKKYFLKELGSLARNIKLVESTEKSIASVIRTSDALIGAVLVKGAKAPKLVTEKMVKSMQDGAVIVDVAIDQGGCIWGSRPTTHEDPIYSIDKKVYCCITNMPGQVPRQSTQALTYATLPLLLRLANKGVKQMLRSDRNFAKGLNTFEGSISYEAVASDLGMQRHYKPFV